MIITGTTTTMNNRPSKKPRTEPKTPPPSEVVTPSRPHKNSNTNSITTKNKNSVRRGLFKAPDGSVLEDKNP